MVSEKQYVRLVHSKESSKNSIDTFILPPLISIVLEPPHLQPLGKCANHWAYATSDVNLCAFG